MSKIPYFFLSDTGQDDVKKEIARPTYWFLKKILGVEAFLDQLSAIPGRLKIEALMPPASTSAHMPWSLFCPLSANANSVSMNSTHSWLVGVRGMESVCFLLSG